jgi:four helix bundle protein
MWGTNTVTEGERRANHPLSVTVSLSVTAAIFPLIFCFFIIYVLPAQLNLLGLTNRTMFSYEKLEVYKKAFELNKRLYGHIKKAKGIPTYVKNQLGRAGLSIMLNIAEGSGKYSARDRRNFFVIARGSVFECSAILFFLYAEGEVPELLQKELYLSLDEISRILYAMIKKLDAS